MSLAGDISSVATGLAGATVVITWTIKRVTEKRMKRENDRLMRLFKDRLINGYSKSHDDLAVMNTMDSALRCLHPHLPEGVIKGWRASYKSVLRKQQAGIKVINIFSVARWMFGKMGREQLELCITDLKRDRKDMLAEKRSAWYVRLCLTLGAFRCLAPIMWSQFMRVLKFLLAIRLLKKIVGGG